MHSNNSQLEQKVLVMLVSPSAMGKSTIMNAATEIDSRFRRVRSFTTRPQRTNDEPGQYFYLTDLELSAKRDNNEIITEVTSPATGQTYGTLAASYDGEYSLLDTFANSVEQYRALPFAQTLVVSLTVSPKLWRQRFLDRYPKPSDEAHSRLDEARLSMNWSLAQTDRHYWLVNDAPAEQVARKLINLTLGKAEADNWRSNAYACLELSQSMWS